MSLQLGADFPSRWLATPYAERRQCLRDLSSVCLLLDPNTDFDEWEKSLQNDTDDVEPITSHTQTPIQKIKPRVLPKILPHPLQRSPLNLSLKNVYISKLTQSLSARLTRFVLNYASGSKVRFSKN